jgi:hypothetical protein
MELVVFEEVVIPKLKSQDNEILVGIRGFTFKKVLTQKLGLGGKKIEFAQAKDNDKRWFWRISPDNSKGIEAVISGHKCAAINARLTAKELLRSNGIKFDFDQFKYSVQTTTEPGLIGWFELDTDNIKVYPK